MSNAFQLADDIKDLVGEDTILVLKTVGYASSFSYVLCIYNNVSTP